MENELIQKSLFTSPLPPPKEGETHKEQRMRSVGKNEAHKKQKMQSIGKNEKPHVSPSFGGGRGEVNIFLPILVYNIN